MTQVVLKPRLTGMSLFPCGYEREVVERAGVLVSGLRCISLSFLLLISLRASCVFIVKIGYCVGHGQTLQLRNLQQKECQQQQHVPLQLAPFNRLV